LAADLPDLLDAPGRVGRGDDLGGIEPGALGRPRELSVRRDVLALAEEGLVERVLELAQPPALAGPEAAGERQRRARLVAREVDLDAHGERAAVDVPRPVNTKVLTARLEQRPRSRPKLERQPLHLDLARVLRRLDDVRLEVRVRADDVVVEADLSHR